MENSYAKDQDDRIELKPARPKGWLDMSTLKKYNKEDLKDMEEEVKKLAVFLKFAKKAKKQEVKKAIRQEAKKARNQDGNLLLDLLHTICKRFGGDHVKVKCPSCKTFHYVRQFGFALLEHCLWSSG